MNPTYPDQPGRPLGVSSPQGGGPAADEPGTSSQNLKDQAKQVASEVSGRGAEAVKDVKAVGQDLSSTAAAKAEEIAEAGKQAGADRTAGIAGATRRVADDLEGTSPEIAQHVRAAADSIEKVAASLRERSVGDLMQEASGFARRQPVAFFGAAVLAGFAVARFAKSSSSGVGSTRHQGGAMQGQGDAGGSGLPVAGAAPGWVPAEDDGTAAGRPPLKPATMSAATLGGAVAHQPGTAAPGSMPTIEKGAS
jgi:hypothetical protein